MRQKLSSEDEDSLGRDFPSPPSESNQSGEEKFIPRILWSEFSYYQPLRIIIKDWKALTTLFYNKYMLVPSALAYKNRDIILCVPYKPFVMRLRKLPVEKQKLIVEGKAVIEIVKTYKRDNFGMRILKVEPIT